MCLVHKFQYDVFADVPFKLPAAPRRRVSMTPEINHQAGPPCDIGLPDIAVKDLGEMAMIGQGSFGKVYRVTLNGVERVYKVLSETRPSEYTKR